MSDINNLPDQFETFAQARKNGFLAAKEVKDKRKKISKFFRVYGNRQKLSRWSLDKYNRGSSKRYKSIVFYCNHKKQQKT